MFSFEKEENRKRMKLRRECEMCKANGPTSDKTKSVRVEKSRTEEPQKNET
jgi:hypothetical protein